MPVNTRPSSADADATLLSDLTTWLTKYGRRPPRGTDLGKRVHYALKRSWRPAHDKISALLEGKPSMHVATQGKFDNALRARLAEPKKKRGRKDRERVLALTLDSSQVGIFWNRAWFFGMDFDDFRLVSIESL